MKSEQKWYVLYTNPRAEKRVASELQKHQYEYYLPLLKTLKNWSDRKKWVEEPLFKSYIFVKTNLEQEYYNLLNLHGVVKFIKIGSEIATLREEQIVDIKLGLEQTTDIELSTDEIVNGSSVEIIAGPLKGKTGLVLERRGNKYFSIEIEQLGTFMLIAIPSNYLKINN